MKQNKTELLLLGLYEAVLTNVAVNIAQGPLHVDIKKLVYESLRMPEGVAFSFDPNHDKWFIDYQLSESECLSVEVAYEDLEEFYDDIESK